MIQKDVLQSIAQEVINARFGNFFSDVLAGRVALSDFLCRPEVEIAVRESIEGNWDRIIDTKKYPYWKREDVTNEDEQFIYRKVIAQMQPIMIEQLHQLLVDAAGQHEAGYFYLLTALHKDLSGLINREDIVRASELLCLQKRLSDLLDIVTTVEKINVILHSNGFLTANPTSNDSVDVYIKNNSSDDYLASISEAAIRYDTVSSPMNAVLVQTTTHTISRQVADNSGRLGMLIDRDIARVDATKPNITPEKGYFKRIKLSGGAIVDEGDTVLGVLPESVVRSLDLRHGDVVRILERDDRGRLKVQLLERAETDESNRVELKFCLVSMRNEEGRSFLAIDEMLVGGEKKRISLPGSKESYLEIKEEDIRFFKLEVGDVVDVAYWVNRPNTFRVIWKYRHVQAGRSERCS
ncbi:hypothetical protein Theco_4052 (plasmid) [Thermobacillus composti KWC4]|uniref:Uncharacterized protein n=1 Tax=Thermobacillus composti (strain DSM 18247 / JCM 13945 / KWC4) TaxID=717605 RepID=L0EIG9_THECK|nr:hypothetical protein [Thermobacillus composti]AGA60053.1 hypothetical protein Theco_4052 [Thermobacillus composti KWC4]